MITIHQISPNTLCLKDPDRNNWMCTYTNNSIGRKHLMYDLERFDANQLWEDKIKDVWTDDPLVPDLTVSVDEIRDRVRNNIKSWCKSAIVSGIDVDCGLTNIDDGTSRGSLHYSLTERKQIDMKDLATMISEGKESVTWRDDSRVAHEVYTATQFMKLYDAATKHILKCRFHSDALESLLDSYSNDDIDKIRSIKWEMDLPESIKNHEELLWTTMMGHNE